MRCRVSYRCLFPDTLIEHIVYQTNLYTAQKEEGRQMEGTTSNDLITFLATNILMGIIRKPS